MKNNKKNNPKEIWKTIGGNLLIWILIIIMSVTALQFFTTDYKPQLIDYTQIQEYVDNDMVKSGVVIGRKFKGVFKESIQLEIDGFEKTKEIIKFTTVLPEVTEEMTARWRD